MIQLLVSGLFTILGALIGFLGSWWIFRKTSSIEREKELDLFYSRIEQLIEAALKKEYRHVRLSLTAPELHYTFSKLYHWIPKTVKLNGKDFNFRNILFHFLKEGSKIEEKVEKGEIVKLLTALKRQWKRRK